MDKKSKLRTFTSFLAICASVVSACICVLLISGDYHSAYFNKDTYERELRGWQACKQTNPAYFNANEQAVNTCLANLNEAKSNFWVKIPKTQWVGILILAVLASACAGYFATWLLICLTGFIIYKFAKLLTFPFKRKANRQRQKASSGAVKKTNFQPSPARV